MESGLHRAVRADFSLCIFATFCVVLTLTVFFIASVNFAYAQQIPEGYGTPAFAEGAGEEGGVSLLSQTDPLIDDYLYDVSGIVPRSTVSNLSGAFNHSIPIAVPPGRNGVQPTLAFTYNSQAVQDLNAIGYGWDISIPYIEHLNKRGLEDLYADPYFISSMSGELATTSDTTIFIPRSDDGSYLKYVFASSTNQWTVTDKNGTVYKFGHATTTRIDNPSDTTKVYRWMLEEVRDTNNNYVKYEYYKNGNFIYPSRIIYTGNGSTDGIFTVDFGRETRPDTATSTAPGFQIEAKYRINQVLVSVNGTWVRKYDLTYVPADNDRRSLLNTITESGQAFDIGTSTIASMPAANFDYQGVTPGWATTTTLFSLPHEIKTGYVDEGVRIFDFNGDALPDVVRAKSGTTTKMYINDGDSWNLTTAWGFPEYFVDSSGLDQGVRLVDVNGDGLIDVLKSRSSGSASYLNTGTGWNSTSNFAVPRLVVDDYGRDYGVRFADVNGDNLVDVLFAEWYPEIGYGNEEVYLNDGTGWATSTWDLPVTFINILPTTKSTLGVMVEDVNDDGLADIVAKGPQQINGAEGVYLNNGSGWTLHTSWEIPTALGNDGLDEGTHLADVNGDKLLDFLDGGTKDVYISTGSNWALDNSWDMPILFTDANGYSALLADLDGDGLVDIVQRNESVHNRFLNQTDPVDSLRHIDESSGSEIDIAYQSSANADLNHDLPFVLQLAASVARDDGMGVVGTTTNQYEDGAFYFASPLDRTFAGFGHATTTNTAGNVTAMHYHQGNATATSTGENDDRRSKIGQMYRSEKYDGSNNLYSLQINGWQRFNRANGADFIFIATSTSLSYDGDADHKDLAETYLYSTSTGYATQKIAWGEVTGNTDGTFTDTGSDKRTSAYTYVASTTGYLILPLQETLTNQVGSTTKETKNYYDTLGFGSVGKGNLTKQEYWVSTATSTIDIEKTYNSYGLVTQDKDPRDKTTNYTYDTFNLYPSTTTNAVSHVVGRLYDYSSGKVTRLQDENNFVFQTLYDPFDRPIEEKQPDLTTPSTLVTHATYAYTDTGMPRRVLKTEYLNSATSTSLYTYTNGNGKTVEERTEAEDSNTYTVRDFRYNARNLLIAETLPMFESGTSYTSTSSPLEAVLLVEYEYDPLQRVKSVTNIEGVTTNVYDQWKTSTTDTLGNVKDYVKDAYGNLVQVVEYNDGSAYTTAYEYDANNKLTKITDTAANIRNFTYDGLGRRLTAEDLHDAADATYGSWTYLYDAAGNLIQFVNPRSQKVNLAYDNINRVLTENWLGGAGTEVSYKYDTCGLGKGWICNATTSSSVANYTYNALGLVATDTRAFGTTTYATTFSYDRKGNITSMTYPDSAQVAYLYNSAGQLESIYRKPSSGAWSTIIEDFDYTPTGKVEYKKFGNNIETMYYFDDTQLYRLTNISTGIVPVGGPIEEPLIEDPALESIVQDFLNQNASESEQTPEVLGTSTTTDAIPNPDTSIIPVDQATSTEATTTPEVIPDISTATTTDAATTTLDVASSTIDIATTTEIATTTLPTEGDALLIALTDKTHEEKAAIKSDAIVALNPIGQFTDAVHGSTLDVLSIEKIDGGVQVFARAWKGDSPLGFGADGTIETERFRIFNPPIMVPDGSKSTTTEKVGPNEITVEVDNFKVDPVAALQRTLAHSVHLAGKENAPIIPGTVGSTVDVFYPNANPESTSVDGDVGRGPGAPETWATIRSATTGTTGDNHDSDASRVAFYIYSPSASGDSWQSLHRSFYLFDTSALPDNNTVAAATLSLYGNGKSDALSISPDINIYSSTPASNTSLAIADYNDVGSTAFSTAVTYSGWSTAGYNDFSLNASGLGAITATGTSKFGARNANYDASGTVPTQSAAGDSYLHTYYADQAGTTNDPKLTVIHSPSIFTDVSGAIQYINYTYDNVGNITQLTDYSTSTGKIIKYYYDDLYRLTHASTTIASSTPYRHSFAYSSIGNITSMASAALGTTTYAYAETGRINPHAPTTIGTTTRSYDNAGNLIREGTKYYSWDFRSQMTASGALGIATTTYTYNYAGERDSKKKGTAATSTFPTNYYSITPGASTTAYIYAGDEPIAYVEKGTTTSSTFYVHPDHLGSTHTVTNATGSVVQVLDYYPFGSERINNQSGGYDSKRKFIGIERDPESGLDYALNRYYANERGQFISQDPTFISIGNEVQLQNLTGLTQGQILTDPQQLNSYAYARNNPVRFTDPKGLYIETPLELALLAFDAGMVGYTYATGGDVQEQLAYLSLDAAGLAIPAGGIGLAARVVNKSDDAVKGVIKLGEAGGEGAGKAFSKSVKDAAYDEAGAKCVFCNVGTPKKIPGPTQSNIDHAIPKVQGGNNTINNAQNTCRTCNLSKSSNTSLQHLQKQLIKVLKDYVKKLGS